MPASSQRRAIAIHSAAALAVVAMATVATPLSAGANGTMRSFTTVDARGAGTSPGQGSILQGIANDGALVGFYENADNLDIGYVVRGSIQRSLVDPGADTGFITPPNAGQGTNSYSTNGSTVVGDFVGPSGGFQGFAFRAGTYSTFEAPDAGTGADQGTMAFSIDSEGVIAGTFIDADGVQHGFIEDRGRFASFNDPSAGSGAGQGTGLTAISSDGTLTGYFVDASGTTHGFTYQAGGFTTYNDPAALPGETFPLATNNRGTVVGDYVDKSGTLNGFVFEHGRYSTVDDPEGAGGSSVADVNDSGVMAGYYVDAGGTYQGFVYHP